MNYATNITIIVTMSKRLHWKSQVTEPLLLFIVNFKRIVVFGITPLTKCHLTLEVGAK